MKFLGICLITGDVERLALFYDEILQVTSNINPVHTDIVAEGAALSIYSRESAKEDMNLYLEQGAGNVTLTFLTEDVEAEYQRLLSCNVKILSEPVTYPWGARSMQLADPDGNVISFAERKTAPTSL